MMGRRGRRYCISTSIREGLFGLGCIACRLIGAECEVIRRVGSQWREVMNTTGKRQMQMRDSGWAVQRM
jgi:hypothetical protein